jgi:2-desacetyl-2-hydroxyethyl bacteriochlorophyllide A dehydrogenase
MAEGAMRTIVLERPGALRETVTDPPGPPAPGMALVRVRRVGVCGTDYHAWRGRQPFFTYPRILGHELAVEVAEVAADVASVRPGDRCAVEPYLDCGVCAACRRGRGNCCEKLEVLGVHVDGGMREWLQVPARKLHPSTALDLDTLALVETLGIGAHAVRRAAPAPGSRVLVVGAGPIGLSVAAFARAAGADVAVMDLDQDRLAFCRARVGIERTLSPAAGDTVAAAREVFGELPLVVFDATGHRGSMERAFTLAAHGGTVMFVGLVQDDITFRDPEFHRRELTLLASRNALPADVAHVIAALEAGEVDVRSWVTHRATLEDVPRVLPEWASPETGVVKAMIDVQGY